MSAINFSGAIVPLLLAAVMAYGAFKRVKVFDVFLKGAKEGMLTCFSIFPALLALVVCVSVLKASGLLAALSEVLSPLYGLFGVPKEVIPITLIRPLSGGGAIAVLNDIFNTYGPDSLAGQMASVMMGSSETTFYTVAVYFGAVTVKNSRYTLRAALLTDCAAFIFATFFVKLLM